MKIYQDKQTKDVIIDLEKEKLEVEVPKGKALDELFVITNGIFIFKKGTDAYPPR